MPNHSIKINRSQNLADHLPAAQREIDDSISPMLVEQLTAAQLAEVRRCLDRHWHKARAFEEQQAIIEGGVWDNKNKYFREFAGAGR